MSDLVLFVEDNADFRDSAARFLELKGYEVTVASDGVEGLEHLQNSTRLPDVIVSDISMPRMNGYEFFEIVRQQNRWKRIPFVFLTALDSRADYRLGWELGVDEYLVKPFRPDDFLAVIKRILNRTRDLIKVGEDDVQATRQMIIHILSHELRTPMTYITGGFDLLAEEINKQSQSASDAEREAVPKILNLIQTGTRRLNRLAEQSVLLAELMSSEAEKKWEAMFEPLDLAYVIDAAITGMDTLMEEQGITMEIDEVPSLYVSGLAEHLTSAVSEVVRNAIQFSPAGKHVAISSYIDPNNPEIGIIQVQDWGRGVDAEDLPKIWDLMSQSQRKKFEQQGLGLGLSITKRIMELHGGTADMESEINVGTIIRLRLPRIELPPEEPTL